MNPRSRIAVVALTALFVLILPPAAAAQSGFRLPLDIGQGAVLDGGPTLYRFDLATHPAWELGRFRVGGLVSLNFANPDWDAGFGARASYMIAPLSGLFSDVGLRAALEYQHTTDKRDLVGAGLLLDPDGLLRIGFWGGYDWGVESSWLRITIGIDLTVFAGDEGSGAFQ